MRKVNCYNMVLEYINNIGRGIPIFIKKIKDYIIKFYDRNEKIENLLKNKEKTKV